MQMDDRPPDRPPVLPPDQSQRFQGDWFSAQLSISLGVGLLAFISFCLSRRRAKVTYAPRTLLPGFSPHQLHDSDSLLGWIWPTLRASEYTVLQIVGLDAAVLLSFYKTCFYFTFTCTIISFAILVPVNYRQHGTFDGVPPENSTDSSGQASKRKNLTTRYLAFQLFFTYVFSLIAMYYLRRAYRRFLDSRQLFALDHAHSVPARTILVSQLPPELQSERALAEYWEALDLPVESVILVRHTQAIRKSLVDRFNHLSRLESAWTSYLGNPAPDFDSYDRDKEKDRIIANTLASSSDDDEQQEGIVANHTNDEESQPSTEDDLPFVLPGKTRPMVRTSWLGPKQDYLELLAKKFREADDTVQRQRRSRYKPTTNAFVTFEKLSSAQIASQTAHNPSPNLVKTTLAPEPRDVYWANMSLGDASTNFRRLMVYSALAVLFAFWSVPVSFLASLLSFESINKTFPSLGALLSSNPHIRALVTTSLPSVALISFNACLPYLLQALCTLQGFRARSWIENSLLKKYFLFLLVSVLFIFVFVSTLQFARELAGEPMKVIEKLATSLPGGRDFFVAYVMFQGLAILPLQLLQLSVLIPRLLFRLFAKTPRDYAELNQPPTLNLGVIYPHGILVFVISLTYSIVAPLVLFFGMLYFGIAYVVFKYKLLFVYFKPYESRGQAWPLSYVRMSWGLLIFQVFMSGIFLVNEAFVLSSAMIPLLVFTTYASYRTHKMYSPLAAYINLSQANEVERGSPDDINRLKRGHTVTRSQTNLNRARYAYSQHSLYVVAEDKYTDYLEPPVSDVFPGVLNTGHKRYGQPALSAQLPQPWLPAKRKPDPSTGTGVIIDVRRRWHEVKGFTLRLGAEARQRFGHRTGDSSPDDQSRKGTSRRWFQRRSFEDESTRAWRQSTNGEDVGEEGRARIGGVIALSDDEDAEQEDDNTVYFHRPDRRARSRSVSVSFETEPTEPSRSSLLD